MNVSTTPSSIDALRRVRLLAGMDDVELNQLAAMTRQRVVQRRQQIYQPDDPADAVCFLLDGMIRVAKLSRDGKEITLSILVPGDLFGEQAILGDGPRGVVTEVLEDAEISTVDRGDFERFVRQRPALAFRLSQLLAARQKEIQERFEELAFRDVPTRLARLLVRLANEHGQSRPEGTVIDLPLTHQEIANLIGATRETTTATLNDFRRAGVVLLGRKRIVITDRARLDGLAQLPRANGRNGNGSGGH